VLGRLSVHAARVLLQVCRAELEALTVESSFFPQPSCARYPQLAGLPSPSGDDHFKMSHLTVISALSVNLASVIEKGSDQCKTSDSITVETRLS